MDRINDIVDLLQEFGGSKPVRKLTVGFHELRAIVVATYDKGESLKEYGGTFSHGNTGNTFQDLALFLDKLIVDGEPTTKFVIQNEEDILEREKAFSGTLTHIQSLVDELKIASNITSNRMNSLCTTLDQVKTQLGCPGEPNDVMFNELERLCKADEELRELKLTMKTTKKSGAKRR